MGCKEQESYRKEQNPGDSMGKGAEITLLVTQTLRMAHMLLGWAARIPPENRPSVQLLGTLNIGPENVPFRKGLGGGGQGTSANSVT